MNPTRVNQATFDYQTEISIRPFKWQATYAESRNRSGTGRFPPILRWRPARPKQPSNDRKQSM